MDDGDWRLQGQEKYLTGTTLVRKRWIQSRPDWDHDHCEFCGAKFAGDDYTEPVLQEGWTDAEQYRWICDACFNDFRERFKWIVAEE